MTSILINSSAGDLDGGPPAPGAYRALCTTADTFTRESQIDEMAYSAGVDPVEFRLGLVADERLATVIGAAARRFGWRFPWYPAGGPALWAKGWLRRGAGIAVGFEEDRRVATCAEVRPDGSARLRVTRIVTAYECGAVVNRGATIGQIEDTTVLALAADVPELEVLLIDRPDLPAAGVGTTPVIALAPAIANAIFAATGTRLHSLPLMR